MKEALVEPIQASDPFHAEAMTMKKALQLIQVAQGGRHLTSALTARCSKGY
jgi:hypothetical protein